jgi:predicted metal-dependent HD superfamily phosphohydrolase
MYMPSTNLPETIFRRLASVYNNDDVVVGREWSIVAMHHTEKHRHYHTLDHLADIIEQLSRSGYGDNEVMLWATLYHDIVYSITAKDNEEKSAALAAERMHALNVPPTVADRVEKCILATKHHEPTGDTIVDLFTDADMSILGRAWPVYEQYAQQVRKEYSIYPDLLYNPGRKKVLNGFLEMDRIFKTDYFYDKYEQAARENIALEIDML